MAQENDSLPTSPVVLYTANLSISMTETNGPLTNQRTTAVLHPDRHGGNDFAIASVADRRNHRSTWLPGLLGGENIAAKHSDIRVVKGLKGHYVDVNYEDSEVSE